MTLTTNISGIGPSLAEALAKKGIRSAEQFAEASVAQLTEIPGIGPLRAKALLAAARQLGNPSPARSISSKGTSADVLPLKGDPGAEKVKLLVVPTKADDTAEKKAAKKKAKAKKKAAAKKEAEKKAAKKKAEEKKAIRKRAKKAIKKKKAKKAARKKLKAKAAKKAGRA